MGDNKGKKSLIMIIVMIFIAIIALIVFLIRQIDLMTTKATQKVVSNDMNDKIMSMKDEK